MSRIRQLTAGMAAAVAVAALWGASVFADSRPSDETRDRDSWRGESRRDRGGDWDRRDDSRNDDRDWDRGRGRDRDRDWDRHESRRHREPYYAHGRVSRVDRYRDGYRVWVGGARYPFHVPHRYYDRNRFRVGAVVQLGGYYNPGGYYDYYDARRGGRRSRADLVGTVERIDYRRDALVVRDERTGGRVTVLSNENIRRRDLRRGDLVEVDGNWVGRGVFRAFDVDRVY